jgi:hypothetical protein
MRQCLAVVLFTLLPVTAHAQWMADIHRDAPIYVGPEATPTPLRVAAIGTRLRVLAERGDWLQVEFGDPQYGRRVGWLQRQYVTLTPDRLTPMDLSVGAPPSAAAGTAGAQSRGDFHSFSRRETSVGWAFLHASEDFVDVNSTLGWNFSHTTNLASWLGIVADIGGHYKTELFGFADVDVMEHTFMGGPRFSFRESHLAVPFAQVLLGLARYDLNAEDEHRSFHDFALQPGGGVDLGGPNVAARFELGWRRVFDDAGSSNEFRIVVGAVFRH